MTYPVIIDFGSGSSMVTLLTNRTTVPVLLNSSLVVVVTELREGNMSLPLKHSDCFLEGTPQALFHTSDTFLCI